MGAAVRDIYIAGVLLKAGAGTRIDVVAEEALQIARVADGHVFLEFNGILIELEWTKTVEDVIKTYMEAR